MYTQIRIQKTKISSKMKNHNYINIKGLFPSFNSHGNQMQNNNNWELDLWYQVPTCQPPNYIKDKNVI